MTPHLCIRLLELFRSIYHSDVEARVDSLSSDKALLDKADCLEKLCHLEWTDKVSSNALRTLYDRKRNNPKVLPLSRDIVKLSKYLDTKGQAATQVLKDEAHEDRSEADKVAAWKELSEVTLSKLILFNRKRQGEPSKMKLAFYKPIKHADVDLYFLQMKYSWRSAHQKSLMLELESLVVMKMKVTFTTHSSLADIGCSLIYLSIFEYILLLLISPYAHFVAFSINLRLWPRKIKGHVYILARIPRIF